MYAEPCQSSDLFTPQIPTPLSAVADIVLRDYQVDSIEAARQCVRDGATNVLICAPTGAGKTLLACQIIKDAVAKGKRVAFVVDRLSLINQTSAVFDRCGISHGVIQGGHERARAWEMVQLCSTQTIARRGWREFDLVIIDECHTVYAVIKKHLESRAIKTIGLTATPFTKGLGKLYERMVNVTTTAKLIKEGFLAGYRILSAVEPDMAGVKVVAGEWVDSEVSERAVKIVGDVVKEYLTHGGNQKFICSAADIKHAEELTRQFMAAGVICACYTSNTSEEEREQTVDEFRKPDSYIKGLVTVTAATKGFDVPDIGVVIMARPLKKSFAEHLQLFGRGLRPFDGKSECLVIDHSGNCERFFEQMLTFFEEGALELCDGKPKTKPKAKDKAKEPMKCPACFHLHERAIVCSHCGFVYPKAATEIQHVAGSMNELIASGDRKAITAGLWAQVCSYSTSMHLGDKEAARKKALGIFKGMTGVWPTEDFHFDMSVDVSAAVLGKIKQRAIAWAMAKKKAA